MIWQLFTFIYGSKRASGPSPLFAVILPGAAGTPRGEGGVEWCSAPAGGGGVTSPFVLPKAHGTQQYSKENSI